MTPPSLFKPKRVCCVCQAEASNGSKKRIPGEARIIAITPVVYRRGTGKGQLRNAPRVQVCEPCLEKALTNGRLAWLGGNEAAKKLWTALSSSILNVYEVLGYDDLSGYNPKAILNGTPEGQTTLQ